MTITQNRYVDTLLLSLSDMHSGGTTALFVNRFWQGKHQNHTPNAQQAEIYKHFEACAEYGKTARKNKRLIMVHNGDAIEGVHHGSIQAITPIKDEQSEIHIELMDTFLQCVKFDRKAGDRLYYTSGTESHTNNKEDKIAKDLPTEKNEDGGRVWDFLELNINGRKVWYLHHGKGRGSGANEGNTLRNWLKDIYWECVKRNIEPPDVVVSGHTHQPSYNTYVIRHNDGFHTIHGIICPSWQSKTRYAWKVAPVDVNEIGAVYMEIKADGEIRPPKFLLKETARSKVVKV